MKALKIVGTVVAVVGLAATGIGLAMGGAAAAGAFAGATAATWTSIGAIASVAAGAIGIGTALFAPKPGFSTQGNPLQFQTNPQSGLPYPIGRTRMSGLRIHADTYDAPVWKSESKQDVLAFAVLLGAGGPMEEIESFRADKELVTFDGSTGNAAGRFADYMAQKVSLGLAGASALALTFGGVAFPGWTADHKLSGMAHALWTMRLDPKGDRYGAGVPEPEWIGKWVKVYDPRLDSTVAGGSGSHRALDESTYEWSANPALHALTWCLGRWQNGKRTLGIGAPVANIRVADFIEAANVADTNAWTCGGVEWSTEPKWTVLRRMLQACGAEPTMTGAMIGCRVNTPRVPIATIEAGHLLDGLSLATTRSRRDRFNTVIPRFRSENHDWQVISGSEVSVAAYVTADGGKRTKEIDFPLVQAETGGTGEDQVGHLAAYEIVNSREAGPIRFTTGPAFVGLKSGDCVTLDVPEEGLDAVDVVIRRVGRDPAGLKISFEAETETSGKHAFALGQTTVPPDPFAPSPPDLTPPTPDAALWDLTAGYAGGVTPVLTLAGVCEFPGADAVLMEYRATGDADWLTLGKAEASSPVNQVITGLAPETSYEARLAYQSGPRIGDWLELGPVSTLGSGVAARMGMIRNAAIRDPRSALNVPQDLLISDDVGTYTRITVSRHDWHYPDNTKVTRNGGAVLSLPNNVTRYIYFDDDTLANANPTYHATADYQEAENSNDHPNRHPVGVITTPVDGGAATHGGMRPGYGLQPYVNLLLTNWDKRNDRIATTPVAPTMSAGAVTHDMRLNGSCDLIVRWSYNTTDEPDHDEFEISLYGSTSSAPYTPGTTVTLEQKFRVPINKRVLIIRGCAPNLWYTPDVCAVRLVDPDVNSSGVLRSARVKSTASGENPYRPSANVSIDGAALLGGELVGDVVTWSGYAATGLNSDGTVKADKVGTAAIIDEALVKGGYVAQGATWALNVNDLATGTMLTGFDVSGVAVELDFQFNWAVTMTNPNQGNVYSFTARLWIQRSGGSKIYSEYLPFEWRWQQPNATGDFESPILTSFVRWLFTAPTAGTYSFGYEFDTPAANGLVGDPYRYMRATDHRATE